MVAHLGNNYSCLAHDSSRQLASSLVKSALLSLKLDSTGIKNFLAQARASRQGPNSPKFAINLVFTGKSCRSIDRHRDWSRVADSLKNVVQELLRGRLVQVKSDLKT